MRLLTGPARRFFGEWCPQVVGKGGNLRHSDPICEESYCGALMQSLRVIAVALLVAGLLPLAASRVLAEPLDKESCKELQDQRKALLTLEMQAALDHGPDWVKDHLEPTELDKVRRFLLVEEKIVFQCRGGGVEKAKIITDGMPLPDRNPNRPATVADAKPSQTVADSDKTPADKAKATQ